MGIKLADSIGVFAGACSSFATETAVRGVGLFGCVSTLTVAILATVRVLTQPNSPTPRTAVSVAKEEQAPAKTPIESANLIPIVHLETQDKFVTVQSGPGGLVYL